MDLAFDLNYVKELNEGQTSENAVGGMCNLCQIDRATYNVHLISNY
jgi:hypothetical protein